METDDRMPLEDRTDLAKTEKRLWRTLARVSLVDYDSDPAKVYLILPGWDTQREISLPLTVFPEEFQMKLTVDYRFFVKANIGTENAKDLYLSDFELE